MKGPAIPLILYCLAFAAANLESFVQAENLSGRWGNLEFSKIALEPDGEHLALAPHFKQWREGTTWRVPASTMDDVRSILEDSGLSASQVDELTSPAHLSQNPAMSCYEIRPSEHAILALSPEQRAALYPRLRAGHLPNPFISPYELAGGGIDAALVRSTSVPAEQIERIRSLTYRIGRTPHFSDINYIFGKAADDSERLEILKLLVRQPAVSLELKLSKTDLIPALAEYWGAHGRNKTILPILESVAAASEDGRLDVVHFLPPFPSKVLNTYPTQYSATSADDLPDCFWTSFSFFFDNPPDRHLDHTSHILNERYERVSQPLQLGDLILFSSKETGRRIHACNYIAGDFVFTKNGHHPMRPWVIMTLDEVVQSYLKEALKMSFFRLKPKYEK